MGIKISDTMEIKSVYVSAKVSDMGNYELINSKGNVVAELNGEYVPNKIIPGEYGDYIRLEIDIETGQILNWKKPTADAIIKAFKLDEVEDK